MVSTRCPLKLFELSLMCGGREPIHKEITYHLMCTWTYVGIWSRKNVLLNNEVCWAHTMAGEMSPLSTVWPPEAWGGKVTATVALCVSHRWSRQGEKIWPIMKLWAFFSTSACWTSSNVPALGSKTLQKKGCDIDGVGNGTPTRHQFTTERPGPSPKLQP